jgi:hypothetical protein
MATINFLYRSNKDKANLTLRLLFRLEDLQSKKGYSDLVFAGDSKISVSKDYWNNGFKKEIPLRRNSDVIIHNQNIEDLRIQDELKAKLKKVEDYIIDEFNRSNPTAINKEWLKFQIESCYLPQNVIAGIPDTLVGYLKYYLTIKQRKPNTVKKINVIKGYIERYEDGLRNPILISEVDLSFKINFENYMLVNTFDRNTIHTAFKYIKTICHSAARNGVEISRQLPDVKSKKYPTTETYLTNEDLIKIKNKDFFNLNVDESTKHNIEELDAARDWLLLSCYSAQRISDFMRFNVDMISVEGGVYMLEFIQVKVEDKAMTIPLTKDFLKILDKRNFSFPKKIGDQKYNVLIKEVCRLAEISEMVEGGLMINKRKVKGFYPKHKLVCSHIGRRTFSSLYWGVYTISELTYITGHSTEQSFLGYMKKGNREKAIEMAHKYKM